MTESSKIAVFQKKEIRKTICNNGWWQAISIVSKLKCDF